MLGLTRRRDVCVTGRLNVGFRLGVVTAGLLMLDRHANALLQIPKPRIGNRLPLFSSRGLAIFQHQRITHVKIAERRKLDAGVSRLLIDGVV